MGVTTSVQPRSAYIHVPFCAHRCGYCNFTVTAGRQDLVGLYLEALERELSWLPSAQPVQTIFVGGGTPTQLHSTAWRQLLEITTRAFQLEPYGEFSVEANPADVDEIKLADARRFGVTRLSLGVQSFDSRKLQILERDHSPSKILDAARIAYQHFDNVSLDLIFGVPYETVDAWHEDLQQAIELAPQHVSTYGLTFEKGTRFWSRRRLGELQPPEEDPQREMYELAMDTLTAAGYEHYEVSNFALPNHRCRHNEVYWTGGEFYAAGPGAARFINGCRETNHRSVSTYLKRVLDGESPVAERECLDDEAAARERMIFGLRRLQGIHCEEFEQQTGFSIQSLVESELDKLLQLKMLAFTDGRLHLTRAGLLVSDSIWPNLL